MLIDTDFASLQARFETRLGDMLSPDELGAFILVLANSMQDESLQRALASRLAVNFAQLQARFEGGQLQASEDDRHVFESLLQTGIDGFNAWQTKSLDSWQAAFNPLRALRPQRASAERFETLQRAFDEQGFHFDKPFLKPETLGEENFGGRAIRVLYHKFPFVAYHLLILLDPAAHHPQLWSEWSNQLTWELLARVAERIPGFGLAYNSLGASASVNHLHVHGFVQQAGFSIEDRRWRHNGGDQAYPLQCLPLGSAAECWRMIERLHGQNQPYNLLFRPSVCYLIVRPPQGSCEMPSWLPDVGWYEASGGFNLIQRAHFDSLTAAGIEAGLARMAL